MRPLTNPPRVGRHSPLLAVAALTLTSVYSSCLVNPAQASADGPTLVSAVSGLLSRTNYRSVPVGASFDGYWSQPQAEAPDRVMYVDDPLGQRGTVQRIEVQPGDGSTAPQGGERAEVLNQSKLSGFRDGETLVMSWGVMIDSTFASPPGGWNNFVQIHADGGGNQAIWQLNLVGDQADLKLRIFGGGDWTVSGQPTGSVSEWLSLGSLPKNEWNDFGAVIRFGCGGTGYTKVWRNGQLLVDARDRKIGYCGDPGMYWKQGFYRSAYDKTTRLWLSDTYRWASLPDADNYYMSHPALTR